MNFRMLLVVMMMEERETETLIPEKGRKEERNTTKQGK